LLKLIIHSKLVKCILIGEKQEGKIEDMKLKNQVDRVSKRLENERLRVTFVVEVSRWVHDTIDESLTFTSIRSHFFLFRNTT